MAARDHGFRNYLIRRALLMIPTFLGVTALVFFLCQFIPGGPIDQYRLAMSSGSAGVGEVSGGGARKTSFENISDSKLDLLKSYYGFDKPPLTRYGLYMKNLLRFDLGKSFRYSVPTAELIRQRLPVSVFYGLITTILTYAICIPLGIVKAIRHRTWFDNLSSVVIFVGYAVPGFALGAVLLALFAVRHDWFPLGGFASPDFDKLSTAGKAKDLAMHAVLPLICYMVGGFAVMTMLMKNSLLENMSADFVKTALANGASRKRAIFGHALRNSLIPLATSFGNNISLIVMGSLFIERVFNIQGLGLLFFEAIQARDYPVVMGATVIGSLLLLVGNLLSDICVAMVDPRVRFQ